MRLTGLGLVAALAAAGGAIALPARAETDDFILRSRAVAAEFQDRLRVQLLAALNGDGPLLALDVCNTAAPAIAEEIGARVGVTVWRVSLRNRNPRGTPDTWERDVLQQFASRLAAGEPPATIEASVQTDAGFRYMAAIPMAPLCAQCHGGAIAPEVAARIASLYPQDRATGFTPGELRGAVSVTWPAAR